MLTLKYITENTNEVITRLAKKHFDGTAIISQVVELDSLRKSTQTQLDSTSAEMNNLSKEIGMLFKQGKQAEAATAKEKTTELKDSIKRQEDLSNSRIGEVLTMYRYQLVSLCKKYLNGQMPVGI